MTMSPPGGHRMPRPREQGGGGASLAQSGAWAGVRRTDPPGPRASAPGPGSGMDKRRPDGAHDDPTNWRAGGAHGGARARGSDATQGEPGDYAGNEYASQAAHAAQASQATQAAHTAHAAQRGGTFAVSDRAPPVQRVWNDDAQPRGLARLLAHPALPGSLVFGLTYLLIAAHQGRILPLFYPAACVIAGIVLYRKHPAHWLSFVLWVTFLTPNVRRFADFFNGAFAASSPILIAPMAVTALGGIGVLRYHRVFAQRRALPLLLVLVGVLYGFCVGIVRVGPTPAIFGLANWCAPILIGFHLLIHWRLYGEFRRVLLKTFRYGALVMGLYGIYQFAVMPGWDALWLTGSQMITEGNPVPFGVRVSSTMNSSGPFGFTAMACMLYLLADAGFVRAVSACVVFVALLLSSVRTAWGGLVIGMLFPLSMLSMRMRMRLIGSALLLAMLAIPLLSIDEISGPVLKRMETLTNLNDDVSFSDRSKFYGEFLNTALTDFAGEGLGSTGAATKLDGSSQPSMLASFDSGLMEIPYVLGWPGTLLFFCGLLGLVVRALKSAMSIRNDRFAASSLGIVFAMVVMLAGSNMLVNTTGSLFYLAVMMPVIARRAVRHGLATQVEHA